MSERIQWKIIHSSEVVDFIIDMKNKRILIIGYSCSLEDLTLYAIKFGKEKVFMNARSALNWN